MSPSSTPQESGTFARQLGFAIVVCGEDLRIRSWNDHAERATGASFRQGQPLSEVFGEDGAKALGPSCRTAIAEGVTSHAAIGDGPGIPATVCPVSLSGGRKSALILWLPAGSPVPRVPSPPPVADACVEDANPSDPGEMAEDDVPAPPVTSCASHAPSAAVGSPRAGQPPRPRDPEPPAARATPAGTTTSVCTKERGEAADAEDGAGVDPLTRELASIETLVDSLSQNRTLPPVARKRLERIREQSARARTLVDRARRALEPPVPDPVKTVCDLQRAIEAIQARLRTDIERLDARVHVLGTLPPALLQAREAESLFETLIRFALAEGDGVAPRLEIGCLADDHPRCVPTPGFRTFFVADNAGFGGGMAGSMDVEPPSADDLAVSSAGAGLAVARRLVERHGGDFWLELDVGRGSRTYFTLPCAN
ncbi:MAG: HAMP domain-containing histidine kinase [Planctomycetes bacterium]|nr:HAMP domain-containing histidine kinase [Planctomycetota bacterium]